MLLVRGMRGEYRIPVGDWASRDSLAEVTEIYERTEVEGSAPLQLPVEASQPAAVVVAPIAYVPMQPMHVFEIPTIAPSPYGTGASPQVRISERLDRTHRVERASMWQRYALIAGIVGAIAIGVSVGMLVSMGGTTLEAPAAAVARPVAAKSVVTVTPIETPKPVVAKPVVVTPAAIAPAPVVAAAPAPVVHREARREHVHSAPAAIEHGMLRISSKPPCAIAIDGKPSGKTTPQAALSLPVGHHQVTLTNEEQGIQLTTEVAIDAAKPTSIVQDFTK